MSASTPDYEARHQPFNPRGDAACAATRRPPAGESRLPLQTWACILPAASLRDSVAFFWQRRGQGITLDVSGFRKAMGLRPPGVTVVTTRDRHGEPWGLMATAVCSVSLMPPLILVCIDRKAECYPQSEVLNCHFARKDPRKFDGVPHRPGISGSPVLADVLARVECRVQARYPRGDHTIFLGEVVGTDVAPLDDAASPLLHFRGGYARLMSRLSTDAI